MSETYSKGTRLRVRREGHRNWINLQVENWATGAFTLRSASWGYLWHVRYNPVTFVNLKVSKHGKEDPAVDSD